MPLSILILVTASSLFVSLAEVCQFCWSFLRTNFGVHQFYLLLFCSLFFYGLIFMIYFLLLSLGYFFFLFLALKGIHLGSFQLSFVQILSAPSSSRLLGSHNACVFSHGSFRLCSLFSIFPLCSPDWSPSLSCLQVHWLFLPLTQI